MNPLSRKYLAVSTTLFLGTVSAWSRGDALTTEFVANGFSRPVFVTHAPGDPTRLFVVEQHTGKIRIVNADTGVVNGIDFIDVGTVSTASPGEQGLLGLAFHPNYNSSGAVGEGTFFVNMNPNSTTTEIRRYQVSANPDVADVNSADVIMTFSQPQTNHNGGWLGFGPNDGYLYISTGDGGGGDDQHGSFGNAQNKDVLLGKILRIDVNGDDFPGDSTKDYAIPPTNPFVGDTDPETQQDPTRDEIWVFGLRNPWRCSFDRLTGDLYIGDVGQDQYEEVDFQPAASPGGENYGWRVMEGASWCNYSNDPIPCFDPQFTEPIHEYPRNNASDPTNQGRAVICGYVYRGPYKPLQGTFFFGEEVDNQIWSFRYKGGIKSEFTNRYAELDPPGSLSIVSPSSFGEDLEGNLYICDLSGGEVFRIVTPPNPGDLDEDGDFTLADLLLMLQKWLSQTLDNQIAHWKLDDASGCVVADSVDSHNGLFVGSDSVGWTSVGTPVGGALKFGGIDDFVEIPCYFGVTGGASRTTSAWIKTTMALGQIVSWGPAYPGSKWVVRTNSDGTLRVEVQGGFIIGTTNIVDDQWHHVAVVLTDDGSPDVSEVVLYVDGQLETVGGQSAHSIDTAAVDVVRIGDHAPFPVYFQGLIADVAIFDDALNPAEISQLVNQGGSSFAGDNRLQALWKLDETCGVRAADASGNDRHGSVINMTGMDEDWVALGKSGGALSFDGVDDLVEIDNADTFFDPNVLGDFSLFAWVKLEEKTGTSVQLIFQQVDSGQDVGRGLLYRVGDSTADVDKLGSTLGGSSHFSANAVFNDTQPTWHHVGTTYDPTVGNGTLTLYIDGQPDGSFTDVDAETSTGSLRIGAFKFDNPPVQTSWSGLIDDVRIFDRALTLDEVQALAFLNPEDLNLDGRIDLIDFGIFAGLLAGSE